MKGSSIFAAVAALFASQVPASSAYTVYSSTIVLQSMTGYPYSCATYASCLYQCSYEYSVTQSAYFGGTVDMTPYDYTSSCVCSDFTMYGTEQSSTTASGTYTGDTTVAGTWNATVYSVNDVDVTFSYTTQYGLTLCSATFYISDGCLLNSCESVGVLWWWWGTPLIIIILISASIGSALRYRRIRMMQLAAAGLLANQRTVVVTAGQPTYMAYGTTTVTATAY